MELTITKSNGKYGIKISSSAMTASFENIDRHNLEEFKQQIDNALADKEIEYKMVWNPRMQRHVKVPIHLEDKK